MTTPEPRQFVSWSGRGPGGGRRYRHEPRHFCFLSFRLACVASPPSLPRFLSPSLTRTKPICSETRVTGGVGKPCSCTLPRDPPHPHHLQPALYYSPPTSALSFSTQLPRPHRPTDRPTGEERREMSALRLCGNLIPVTRPRRYNALAPRGVTVLHLRSSPPGF